VGLGYLWAVVALVTSAGLLASSSLSFSGGSLSGRTWDDLRWLAAFVGAAVLPAAALVRPLDALAPGNEVARSLGARPALARAAAAMAAGLLAGPAVWAAGMVPLVGLACAQGARQLWGHDHRLLVPGAAALGAAIVLAADVAARSFLRGTELPLGIVTACVGVPVLVAVAWRASWRVPY
jgi:iron complex transport system permease protein